MDVSEYAVGRGDGCCEGCFSDDLSVELGDWNYMKVVFSDFEDNALLYQ